MHAARVAEALGVDTVVVPPNAGVLSAYGLVVSDWVQYEMLTKKIALDDAAPQRLVQVVEELEARARSSLRESGVEGEALTSTALYMRFTGQAFEIEVQTPESVEEVSVASLRRSFDAAYERIFLHHANAERPVEIVSVRVGATVPRTSLSESSFALTGDTTEQLVPVYENGCDSICVLNTRGSLRAGAVLTGPAIMTDETSTLYVPPQWCARHDEHYNLIMTRTGPTS
jgi:N-methylhydantoinase A